MSDRESGTGRSSRKRDLAALRAAVSGAPHLPGVYSFVDRSGDVLYIGKAGDLNRRLSGHLSSGGGGERHKSLLRRAVSVEWTVTRSEKEALVLEAELIRLHKPPLNVRLRDGIRYPWLEVTLDEEYPRLVVTRHIDHARKIPRFGPYPDARTLRRLVAFLLEAYPLRRCEAPSPRARKGPCLMGQMGRCPGACCGRVSSEEYGREVRAILSVLRGDWETARSEMRDRMSGLSSERRFEEAAHWRDLIARLESFGWPHGIDAQQPVNRDVVVVRENWGLVLQVRSGRQLGSLRLPFNRRWKHSGEEERMSVLLRSYYAATSEIPAEIVVSVRPSDEELIREWLQEKRGRRVSILDPSRGEKKELVDLAARELDHFLARLAWDRPRGGARKQMIASALSELREELGLDRELEWIVGVDASTLSGSYPVAAVVSFRGGLPDKEGYRRFSMPRNKGRDDPAMIGEAVRRYLKGLAASGEDAEVPDLLLVDGGITQLRSAVFFSGEWPDRILFVAIAKGDESLLVGRKERKLQLPLDRPALALLRRIRDEAHRFVIHYHRLARSRGELRSRLEDIPGVGPATRAVLLSTLGSVERIASATPEQLSAIPGIGRKRARLILDWLNPSHGESDPGTTQD
jgi:excinuclease ABC subunit C